MLEKKLNDLQNNHESPVDDCEGAHKAVKAFDIEKDVKALKNERVEIGKGTEAVKQTKNKNTKLDKSKKHQTLET